MGLNINYRLVLWEPRPRTSTWVVGARAGDQPEALAKRAMAKKLGLWGACPRTVYDPYRGVDTRS